MTLSKERLKEKLNDCERYHHAHQAPINVKELRDVILELLERRERDKQEPVAIVDIQSGRSDGNKLAIVFTRAAHALPDDVYSLYAAPPARVVPDEMTRITNEGELIGYEYHGERYGVTVGATWNACRAAMLQSSGGTDHPIPDEPALHPDDQAFDRFALACKEKLSLSRQKGRGGWDDPDRCPVESLARMLVEHLCKGNAGTYEDVATFAMMLHQRGAAPKLLADVAAQMASEELQAAERGYAALMESHAQVIQARDHYKNMVSDGLKKMQFSGGTAPVVPTVQTAARLESMPKNGESMPTCETQLVSPPYKLVGEVVQWDAPQRQGVYRNVDFRWIDFDVAPGTLVYAVYSTSVLPAEWVAASRAQLFEKIQTLATQAHQLATTLDVGKDRTEIFGIYHILHNLSRRGYAEQVGKVMNPLLSHSSPVPVLLRDDQIRDLVNELRDIAVDYLGTQQLRERLARAVRKAIYQTSSVSDEEVL